MSSYTQADPSVLIEEVIDAVSHWPGMSVHDHRFGGREFRLGSREVGHVHYGGLVDIAYPRVVRDALVKAGRTTEHHIMGDSGWTSYRVRTEGDVPGAIDLLRLSYLYHALSLSKSAEGAAALAAMDVDAELDALALPPAARQRVEVARTRAGV